MCTFSISLASKSACCLLSLAREVVVAEVVEVVVDEDGVDSVVVAAAFATGFFIYLEKQTGPL